jgi:hypothetical protein
MAKVCEHVIVYKQPTRFGGWPANNGIWQYTNRDGSSEIVVGFTLGFTDYGRLSGHPIYRHNQLPAQARSFDGGSTWEIEENPHKNPDGRPIPACTGDITFTQKDFALKFLRTGEHAGNVSWFWISYDRCHQWYGPYSFPMLGLTGIAARTDYQVYGPHECLVFMTAPKADGYEGRAFCARTRDGGRTFQFVSWIGPVFNGWSIMPSSVRLPSGRLVVALRCRYNPNQGIQLFSSDDEGATWQFLSEPVGPYDSGNPPAMIRLADGRIALTYGQRLAPFGMRARISEDNGATWEDEIVLRDDAGTGDLGYPRTVQRPDGKILTVYYYNDPPEKDGTITDRYIAATIWEA